MQQLETLENKRDQHRSRIRKIAHKKYINEKRQHLLKSMETQAPSLQQLQKICSSNTILQIQYGGLIQQLIQHYSSNKMVVLSSLANLLMEPLAIDQLQQVVLFILKQPLDAFDYQQPICRRIMSFMIMALFRQYDRLAEEQQLKMEDYLLPIIFTLMASKEEEAQMDGLHSIIHILTAPDEIEAYYKLKRNHRVIRRLFDMPIVQSLQPYVIHIYGIMARVDIPLKDILGQLLDQFNIRVTTYITMRYSNMADETLFHRLKEETAFLVQTLVSRQEITSEMTIAIINNWQSLSIGVLYQLTMQYPEALDIERSALLSVLESIKDTMAYTVCLKDQLTCLKALHEILKFQYGRYGANAEAICGWMALGGNQVLQMMENHKGQVGSMAHTIMSDIFDSIQ